MHASYSRNSRSNVIQNFIDKIRLFFLKEKESYLCFYRILGFYPHNIQLYHQALLHKSTASSFQKGKRINNERLEFLGDAVLDAVVAHLVYEHFEGKGEGFLTNTRSKIVQRETLNKLAVQIGLDKLIKSDMHLISHNSYLSGNAFEAFVGAIYLDRGYKMCCKFIGSKIINRYIDLDKVSRKEVNFKSKLIEWGQKNKFEIIFNLVKQDVDQVGNPFFNTEILIEGHFCGKGTGYSKKESQQIAARSAWNKTKEQDFIILITQSKEDRQNSESDNELSDGNIVEDLDKNLPETDPHPLSFND